MPDGPKAKPKGYLERHDAAHNSAEHVYKVAMAMIDVARDVASEPPSKPNHANRVVFATHVVSQGLDSPSVMAMSRYIADQTPGYPWDATDAHVKAAVAQAWDLFAGLA